MHPYEVFYLLWRLSYLFGVTYADLSVAYEDLCTDSDTQLARVMAAAGVPDYDRELLASLIEEPRSGRWRTYATVDWFERLETRCERLLRTAVASLPKDATVCPSTA